MLSAMKTAAALVVILGGLGAVVDFLISSAQKEKIKNWMLAKWVKFEDMKLSNFSEKEAMYFVELSDGLFGTKLFSWKRILVCVAITAGCYAVWLALANSQIHNDVSLSDLQWYPATLLLLSICLDVAALAISLSLSRVISARVIKLAAARSLGILPYVALMIIHILLFLLWRPLIDLCRHAFVDMIFAPDEFLPNYRSWFSDMLPSVFIWPHRRYPVFSSGLI